MSKKQAITFMSAAQMDKEFPLIAAAGKKLDERIQQAAMSAVNHFVQHKDTVYINRLYLSLSAGVRRSALTVYFLAFAGVKANDDKDTKKDKPFLSDHTKRPDLEEACRVKWYDCKKEPEPDEVFDAGKMFALFMRRLNGAIEAHKPITGLSESQIARLRAVMAGDVAEDVKSIELK